MLSFQSSILFGYLLIYLYLIYIYERPNIILYHTIYTISIILYLMNYKQP
jgi:hypothetical protein